MFKSELFFVELGLYLAENIGDNKLNLVIGIDLLETDQIPDTTILKGDFRSEIVQENLKNTLKHHQLAQVIQN